VETLFFLIMAAATVYPMWRILERIGVNPLCSLVSLTGIGLVALLWVLAFVLPDGRGA
jgi:hypothetical protein